MTAADKQIRFSLGHIDKPYELPNKIKNYYHIFCDKNISLIIIIREMKQKDIRSIYKICFCLYDSNTMSKTCVYHDND